ncbi:two-component system response regulator [Marinobacter sp. EhC06]|jgi:CheY-like chemotaxis protein|uniref:response regulator n=2 Tax=Marinobacteraceae TaxID=2887365 RepID=UPI0007D8E798|nr:MULTISPECIES: response regulator [unclassified Marinobacter]OAN87194.1 two-component system response regulator [Marinobacter sp. EhN04]OAN89493.1 two-component system response regulator [Marinobacter sp. EhC06]|tara:strand:+ start:249 stop:701 length:453 start_codon:yes stop_codon:yes gene_type:complete|mmetsp:Transcript_19013/g.28659  ORF Transcript_19013/g.28659 Transcript_19013/m.28659 type:complete len:151 (-) Transcript_19013:190-642(-)
MDVRSILVIEDNPDDQILTVRALKSASVDSPVIVLEDGEEALKFLFGDGDQPSRNVESLGAVLLDVKLPKVGGLEVLRHLRSSPLTQWLPVIMVTSSDEPADLLEAYRLGANSFITKPINYREFVEQMTLLARYWLKVNRVPNASAVRSF